MTLTSLLLLGLFACSDKDAGPEDDDDGVGLDSGFDGGSTDGGSGDGGSGDAGSSDTDADNDGYDSEASGGDDCDDSNPDIHPFADEYCNGIDDDCDGNTDEDSAVDATRWFPDVDEDGYGDDDESDFACDEPDDGAWITTGGDCDDEDDAIHPGADETCDGVDEDCDEETDEDATDAVDWFRDVDEDGFGGDTLEHACSAPDDGAVWTLEGGDCADDDDEIHPDADEVCDDIDNDCDDLVDDADPDVEESTWSVYYADVDEDGYGDADEPLLSCSVPGGHVTDDSDCDDSRDDVNPGETEVCDDSDTDEDCSGAADDDDPDVASGGMSSWTEDADRDGYGSTTAATVFACDDPSSGGSFYTDGEDTDCDDDDPSVNPGETEVCDDADTDEDCSGSADDDDSGTLTSSMSTWYLDGDYDGYGSDRDGETRCDDPTIGSTWYVADDTDCDDDDADVNPGEREVCDDADTDEDCSGAADDDDSGTLTSSMSTWYLDDDGDSYGDPETSLDRCDDPSDASDSWVDDDTDCDDEHDVVNPGADEVCDAYDNDCDPATSSDGFVTFTSDAGAVTDYTADFAAGSSSSPAAITIDEDGELSLCGGTLYTQLTIAADVRLVGLFSPVLSGGNQGTVVIVQSSADTVSFTDLEITEGNADQPYGSTTVAGGGIWCSGSNLVFDNTIVSDSDSDDYAAGIYAASCPVTADGLVVHGNTADVNGGGLWLQGSTHTIINSEISENAGVSGGGILMRSTATLDLIDSWVIDNYSSTQASAAYLTTDTLNCIATSPGSGGFLRNFGGSSYGAVRLSNSGVTVTSDDCDWGEGDDDNEPYDLHSSYWVPTAYNADGIASFTCTGSTACE